MSLKSNDHLSIYLSILNRCLHVSSKSQGSDNEMLDNALFIIRYQSLLSLMDPTNDPGVYEDLLGPHRTCSSLLAAKAKVKRLHNQYISLHRGDLGSVLRAILFISY